MNALDEAVDELELLDFDAELECETLSMDCPNKAEWMWTFHCCGSTALVCDPHHTVNVEWKIITAKQTNNTFMHLECGATIKGEDMTSERI